MHVVSRFALKQWLNEHVFKVTICHERPIFLKPTGLFIVAVCLVLSSTILDPRVVRIMDELPPSLPVPCVHQSLPESWSHPSSDVNKPAHPRPPSCSCSRYISLYDLFLQAFSAFSHQMSKLCEFPSFNWIKKTSLHSHRLQHPFVCFSFPPWHSQDVS